VPTTWPATTSADRKTPLFPGHDFGGMLRGQHVTAVLVAQHIVIKAGKEDDGRCIRHGRVDDSAAHPVVCSISCERDEF